jgi:hypothetical protein
MIFNALWDLQALARKASISELTAYTDAVLYVALGPTRLSEDRLLGTSSSSLVLHPSIKRTALIRVRLPAKQGRSGHGGIRSVRRSN